MLQEVAGEGVEQRDLIVWTRRDFENEEDFLEALFGMGTKMMSVKRRVFAKTVWEVLSPFSCGHLLETHGMILKDCRTLEDSAV